ncbi:Phospholipid methyltransferase [Penicillium bovifimosum]|uniref:Phospholipid methyltransferase n=1 Tax=Penicillium bovifimosum TaxID=126998 RepID=A0A9W9H657_9EURO|nr:Phospholipid methyltransferase [Penicillium bovifimosum]KAJ5139412.1 Phospholipid methyltransferase [Penicillium bovifimosum]
MGELSSVLLAAAMVAAGVLSAICATSPTPAPAQKSRQRDRLGIIAGTFPIIARRIALIVVMYHALLVVIPHYAPGRILQVCPQPQNLRPELFTWNICSITSLLLVYVGAYVRLSAYGGLGKFFTFHLTVPDHLVTTGIYRWVQHPSYTGAALVAIGITALFTRWGWHTRLLDPRVSSCSVAGVGIEHHGRGHRTRARGIGNKSAGRRRHAEAEVWAAVGGVAPLN